MKRSALVAAVVLLAVVLTLSTVPTVAQGPDRTDMAAPTSYVEENSAGSSQDGAGTVPPHSPSPQQGGWRYGPPSDFQYQRFDGVFVPGPEPWGNKVYFMGGRTSASTELPHIWAFDPRTGTYADTQADMVEDVSNYHADLIMDDGLGLGPAIYVVGGYDRDNAGANIGTVQRYYPQANYAEALPSIDDWPGQVAGLTVGGMGTAVVDDVIYVWGGWESSVAPYFYDGTWIFDPRQPSGSRWTDLGLPITPARSYIQMAVQEGKIYSIGGIYQYVGGDLVPTDTVEVLDTANLGAGWVPLAPLPLPTAEGRAFGFDDDTKGLDQPPVGHLYLTGGGDWPATSTEVLEYFIFTNTWDLSFPDLNEPRVNHAGSYIPLYSAHPDDGLPGMWVFGGRSHNGCDPPYAPTEYYSFPTPPNACNILLVDDDWDQYSGEPYNGTGTYYYTSTLDAIGLNYDRWDVWTQGDPSLADLQGYDAVIWFTGYAWEETLTPTNELDLAAYLDGGGNLFFSSEDYIWDRGITDFGTDYLGIAEAIEDTGEVDLIGNAGDPVGAGLGPYTITVPTSWPSGSLDLYTDEIVPLEGFGAPFRYQASGEDNSTDQDSGIWRTVFVAWPFEGLDDLEDRVDVMSAVLDWFCFNERPAEVILLPPSQTGRGVRGTEVTYTLTMINNTGAEDTFTLDYAAVWPIAGPAAIGPIADATAQDFVVTVTVPADSNCGDMDTAVVTATSQLDPDAYQDSALIHTYSDPPGSGSLSGTVYDANTGLGIADAFVYVEVGEIYLEAHTDGTGAYTFPDAPACTYSGEATAMGYYGAVLTPTVEVGLPTVADAYLAAAIPVLSDDAVSVTVSLGFRYTYPMTLANAGSGDLHFHVTELAAEAVYPPSTMPTGVDPQVYADLADSPKGRGTFIVYLAEQADLSAAFGMADRSARGRYVLEALRATAERSQAGLLAELDRAGVDYTSRCIVNAVVVEGDRDLVDRLIARPEVAYIGPNSALPAPAPVTTAPAAEGTEAIEWNIGRVGADKVWDLYGVTGAGIVVANIDTGVDYDHAALVNQYRGNLGGSFDHDYNWWDPYGDQPGAPYDYGGHGSHTMGTMLGSDDPADPLSATNAIGMAPGAAWFACNGFDHGGWGYNAELLECAEFVLAPWDLSGANPNPDLRADVVNNSWGGGQAQWWYNQAVYAWRAAGMFPVFSAGNEGPGCETAGDPGDMANVVAVGATDVNDSNAPGSPADFSSRGPALLAGLVKPDVSAPGADVRSAIPGDDYASWGGTSMAAPHVAGEVALLWSAQPELRGDVQVTAWIVEQTAEPLLVDQGYFCGDDDAGSIPNNQYGWGRINAYDAVELALSNTWDIAWLAVDPISGVVAPSLSLPISLTFDAAGLEADACYTGTLKVEYNDPYVGEEFVPVELCVVCEPVHEADFAWVPLTPTAGQVVTFTAQASGTWPISFTWNFGDGTGAVGITATHNYTAAGSYPVVLTAMNCGTATATAVHTVTVEAACEPVHEADFGWMPITPSVGQVVTFTAQASGTEPISFTWDFGGGEAGAGQTVTYTYPAPGDYTVIMTATNCTDTASMTVEHTVTVPCESIEEIDFAWDPLTPTVGQVVVFTPTADGSPPRDYDWDLGDGGTGWGKEVTHTYTATGLYTVVLTVTNDCSQQIVSHTLTVEECEPITGLDFSWVPITPTVGQVVTFTAEASGTLPISFIWHFGDGMGAVGITATHSYTAAGSYPVVLTATNCGTAMATAVHTVTVEEPVPPPHLIYLPILSKSSP